MNKSVITLAHIGYWLLFSLLLLTFYFFAVYLPGRVQPEELQIRGLWYWLRLMTGFAIVPGAISFYLHYTLLFSKLPGRRRFLFYLLISCSVALGAAVAGAAVASLPFVVGPGFLFGDGYRSARDILVMMTLLAWVNGVVGAIIKGCVTWYKEISLKDELRSKNREIELELVKSQIDPHFLFNTLNNIDVMISRNPAAASGYLNKLSGIMRFLLYQTKTDEIALEDELRCVQQYIDLEKIRTSNTNYVDFQNNVVATGKRIAPMVLLSYVENAFKHTGDHKLNGHIKIRLNIKEEKLIFECNNTVGKIRRESGEGGVGNDLIRKRLELLYPNRHVLSTDYHENIYQVKLELDL